MQDRRIQGMYFDGRTSNRKTAVLFYRDDGRVAIEGSHRAPIAVSALKISARIGNTARYLEFPDGGQFETGDNDAVDAMCRRLEYRDRSGVIHTLESHKRYVLATLAVVVLFAWGFIQYGVPALSRELALMLPDEASQYMGAGVLDVLDRRWLQPTTLSNARQSELRALFKGYARHLDESLPLTIEFRRGGPLQANAFALPDGTIVFTDELIELAGDDREIGAVMLHEIGHVHFRHSVRAALQKFSLAMLVMVVTGDVSTSSSVITALPVLLVETGYSRDMEWEADGFALDYMQRNGMDPAWFAAMMEKLEARYSHEYDDCIAAEKPPGDCLAAAVEGLREETGEEMAESYLSTHPMSKARVARFRSYSRDPSPAP